MLRMLLGFAGIVLSVTGVAELVELSASKPSWVAGLWAVLALVSGAALTVGAWRTDGATLAAWFRRERS